MAEIAAIFHWPLHELQALTLDELIDWHARAVDIWKARDQHLAGLIAKALGG